MSNCKFAMTVAAGMAIAGPAQALATAPGLSPPPEIAAPGELVVPVHCIPLKGSKGGGTCGTHKQCLYGVYGWGWKVQKGLHYHAHPHDRGQPCGSAAGERGVIRFGNEPKFRPKPPPRLFPPSQRR